MPAVSHILAHQGQNTSSLESEIWNTLRNKDDAYNLTCSIIGRKSSVPHMILIGKTERYLARKGLFSYKNRWIDRSIISKVTHIYTEPICSEIIKAKESILKRHLEDTKCMLSGFKQRKNIVFNKLHEEVSMAIYQSKPDE